MNAPAAFESIRGHTVFVAGLPKEPVVVDLGANRGEFSRQVSSRFAARCYLVEANPELTSILENGAHFPVWKCVVSASDGRAAFRIAQNDEASTALELTAGSLHSGGVREVLDLEAKSLQTLLSEMDCSTVDLLKMDIEGGEVGVLRSTPADVLRRIGQITAEFHSHGEFGFQIGDDVEQVIARLEQCGFIFLDFSYGTRRDVLFINRARHRVSRVREMVWKVRVSPPHWLRALWSRLPPSVKSRLRPSMNIATEIERR